MPVTAPPRPPSHTDTVEALREQALIKEARERARRRHQRYAAAVAIATAIIGAGAAFAMRPDNGGAQPSAAAHPLAPAAPNGTRSTIVFAVLTRGTLLYRINADGTGLHRLLSWKTQFRVAVTGRPGRHSRPTDARSPSRQALGRRPGIDVANLDGTDVHWINARRTSHLVAGRHAHRLLDAAAGDLRGAPRRDRLATRDADAASSPPGHPTEPSSPTSAAHPSTQNARACAS